MQENFFFYQIQRFRQDSLNQAQKRIIKNAIDCIFLFSQFLFQTPPNKSLTNGNYQAI
ncbi:hypothetical protein [Pedobacter psychrotolerans]|uniref:hypothetical protein n=1 Tax=Pedobacter psychrotolerans TaxID=1843235 RepID=UPI003F98EFCD